MKTRLPLENGTIIELDGKKYKITDLYNSGGSCLVYDAEYYDNLGQCHKVRVKEFYPIGVNISRKQGDRLIFNDEKELLKYQERFINGIKFQSDLRSSETSINDIAVLREISYANGTIYSVLDFYNGSTMESRNFDSIHQVIYILMNTAVYLKKYHDSGYVYLDLKPDNIFCMRTPDGSDKVLLFDFDSMIRKEDLEENRALISCSPKFAAPELKKTRLNLITDRTDFYSLGCILFSYAMGKFPDALDQMKDARWSFNTNTGLLKKLSDEFYDALNEFFHKTIAGYQADRYNNDEELIYALKHLYELSEIKEPVLESNFASPSTFFVGREKEVQMLHSVLSGNGRAILNGVGGIGKTSIAVNYAAKYQEYYDTVIFLRCNGEPEHLLDDVPICNICAGADKMSILHELCNNRVLIIIDNLEGEEDIDAWIDLPCKLIITSRAKYIRSSVEHIEISGLSEADVLFYHYCDRNFTDEQMSVIRRLLHYLCNHTMTIELLAKLLRNPDIEPETVFERITGAALAEVNHEKLRQIKDYQPRRTDIEHHIDILFDLFSFTEEEQECIYIIAIIGVQSLKKSLLFKWCDFIQESTIDSLIQKGWIQYDSNYDFVSLHPLVADRAIFHLYSKEKSIDRLICTLKNALENSVIMTNEARNYILSICENASSRIRNESRGLAEFETAVGTAYLGRRISRADKHFMRAESIFNKMNPPVLPIVFNVFYSIKKLEYGKDVKEALADLNNAFRRCTDVVNEYMLCISIGKAASSLVYSYKVTNDSDRKLLSKWAVSFFEKALNIASCDTEKKYAANQIYDIYSDCTTPLYSESKALKYRDLADRGVTIIYKDKVVEKTEQEKQSDQLEAMMNDGNTAGMILLAGKIYAKFKITGKPLDPYLSVQMIGIMKKLKRYSAAIALLEAEKNEYNCLEIVRISIKAGKNTDIRNHLNRAERYWTDRLKNSTESPGQYASVLILKSRFLHDDIAKMKAERIISAMLDNQLRLREEELAIDCFEYSKISDAKDRVVYLYFFAALADTFSLQPDMYNEYLMMYKCIEPTKEQKLIHTYFRAEYEDSEVYLKKAVQLSEELYGNDDYRTATLKMEYADKTGRLSDRQGINFGAVYERKISEADRFSEKVTLRLRCIEEYNTINDSFMADELLTKLEADINNISNDSYEYYICLKKIIEYYHNCSAYDKVNNYSWLCFEAAPDNEKWDICMIIANYCKQSDDTAGHIAWLEKSIGFLESMANMSQAKQRKLIREIKEIEELYLSIGNYNKASFYRDKYNAMIQYCIQE